ncbi:unnamed protein product [Rhizopus stolonifer]
MTKKLSINELEDSAEELKTNDDSKPVFKYTKKMITAMAEVLKKEPSISHFESVYNYTLIYRCIEAVILLLENGTPSSYFVPGEEELKAMTSQLAIMGRKMDHKRRYEADEL